MSKQDKNWKNKAVAEIEESFEVFEQQGIQVMVSDLRPGDQLVTKWSRSGQIAQTAPIKSVDECPGMWRTHVHINRMNCYDGRGYAWIK